MKGDTGLQGPEGNVTIENFTGLMTAPAYDSGWILPNASVYNHFVHNLNTTEVLVWVIGKWTNGITQVSYGNWVWWEIESANEILVWVDSNAANGMWQLVRVMLWKIAEP